MSARHCRALRISAGSRPFEGHPEIGEGASGLRCEPTNKKHLRPCPTLAEILRALVGLKDVRVLHYERRGPDVELMVEQVVGDGPLPALCGTGPGERAPGGALRRPAGLRHADVAGLEEAPHALREPGVPPRGPGCSRTTASRPRTACSRPGPPSGPPSRSAPAAPCPRWPPSSACDWHTVNDAVTTYGEALLEADRKRLNKTTAIGLDETSFVKARPRSHTSFATTVADVENHQIIDILPTRNYTEVARLDRQAARGLEGADPLRRPRHVGHLRGGVLGHLAQGRPGGRPLPRHRARQPLPRRRASPGADRTDSATGGDATIRSIGPAGCCSWAKSKLDAEATERLCVAARAG